jgi:2-hydroxy-6-oxonona-2,4-dienedioate hydrolase
MSFDNNNNNNSATSNKNDNKKKNNGPPERFIIINGYKIKYLDYNQQIKRFSNIYPILVLLHGLGASGERWLNVAPMLSKYFRIIIPDIIGFGHSDKSRTEEYKIDYFVRFLQAFLDKLNIDRPIILCGHSLGGYLATEFSIAFNNRVDKLVLVAPAGVSKSSTRAVDKYIFAALYPIYEDALKAFVGMAFDPRFITEDSVRDFTDRMRLPNAKYALISTLLGLRPPLQLRERLSQVLAPILIIWGENDEITPLPDDKYLQEYHENPKNRSKTINHCGHTPFVEKPIRFLAILLKFLIGKDLYSRLYIQMTDQDREKEKNMHMCEKCIQCAQYGCLIECPLDKCLYEDINTFTIPKCRLCQGDYMDA